MIIHLIRENRNRKCLLETKGVKMKKGGIYFTKKEEETKTQTEENIKPRKGIKTALVYVALTIAAVFIYIVVRTKGLENMIPLLLVLAVAAVCIEISWADPDRKPYVLWKKLFNKE